MCTMDSDKLAGVQYQVRQNAEELQDFLRDLNNWEHDMKQKEQHLRQTSKLETNQKLPPIRNAGNKQKKKQKRKEERSKISPLDHASGIKAKRISGFDYDAWENFDAEKALQEVDAANETNRANSGSEETEEEDEDLELEHRIQKAIMAKDEGNRHFASGRFDEAIAFYTQAMGYDGSNAILPANRAMALMKKGQLAAADADCSLAVSLDPTYVKAYHRRGKARFGLGKYELAKEDYLKALELEPGNRQTELELERVNKALGAGDSCTETTTFGIAEQHKEMVVSLGSAAPQEQQDVSVGNVTCRQDVSTLESLPHHTSVKTDAKTETQVMNASEQSGCVVHAIHKPPHLRSKKPLKRIDILEVDGESDEEIPEPSSVSFAISSKVAPSPPEMQGAPVSITIPRSVSAPESFAIPPVPQTSYQFMADWRRLGDSHQRRYEYLKQILPEKFPQIFRQSMESELFVALLRVFQEKFMGSGVDVFPYLKQLVHIGRFGTMVMFLSSDERKVLSLLFEALEHSSSHDRREIEELKLKYGM